MVRKSDSRSGMFVRVSLSSALFSHLHEYFIEGGAAALFGTAFDLAGSKGSTARSLGVDRGPAVEAEALLVAAGTDGL